MVLIETFNKSFIMLPIEPGILMSIGTINKSINKKPPIITNHIANIKRNNSLHLFKSNLFTLYNNKIKKAVIIPKIPENMIRS